MKIVCLDNAEVAKQIINANDIIILKSLERTVSNSKDKFPQI